MERTQSKTLPMDAISTSTSAAQLLTSTLVEIGITTFFCAPGNRNAPLIHAIESHPKAIRHSHFDERGLGFMALGYTQASGNPSALVVTSGSAVLNLIPAVAEAFYTNTPLVIITADRPFDMTHTGTNQTIDQRLCFGPHVTNSIEIMAHDATTPKHYYSHFLSLILQKATTYDKKPIHLNIHFKKPLQCNTAPSIPICSKYHPPEQHDIHYNWKQLSHQYLNTHKGIVIIGALTPEENQDAIIKFIQKLGWLTISDPLSSLRHHKTLISIHQYIELNHTAPKIVLYLGGKLVSEEHLSICNNSTILHIDTSSHHYNPMLLHVHRYICSVSQFCKETHPFISNKGHTIKTPSLVPHTEEEWLFHSLKSINCPLFVGNSLAIRACDRTFFPLKPTTIFSQRGCSGIDGNLAHAIGIAFTTPLVAIVGDLTFLYDTSTLFFLKQHPLPITFIILNNQGGGIFKQLPNIENTEPFVTPHEHSMGFLHTLFPGRYTKINTAKKIPSLMPFSLKGPFFIEISLYKNAISSL